MLTVLIAEDDPYMCKVIRNTVSSVPDVEVVGEAVDGEIALRLFESLKPQVIFIDIDLPKKNGLILAQEIFDVSPWTYIVFCTGFSEYQNKAFEIYAFDYLVKPFKLERITKTLNRIKEVYSGKYLSVQPEITVSKKTTLHETMLFKKNKEFVVVELKDILFFTKENRKTIVYYTGGKMPTDDTLDVLEEKLKNHFFFRSHKAFLVNFTKIRKIVPSGNYTHELIMTSSLDKPLLAWKKLKQLEKMLSDI